MRAWSVLLLLALATAGQAEPALGAHAGDIAGGSGATASTAAVGMTNPEGPHEVVLFLHANGQQDMAMTPMAPPAGHHADQAVSPLGWSTCVSTPGQSLTGKMQHSQYAFVSPVPVPYDPMPRTTSHRGILGDLTLPAQEAWLHLYVTMPQVPVTPEVVLRATLREGDAISVGHAAMDAGRLLAQAETEPATLGPHLQNHPHVTRHGEVYGFALPIPLAATTVPREESFNLRIDLFVDEPACADGHTMPSTVAYHTSPAHRPRLALEAQQVLRINRLAAVLREGAVDLEATVTPVFGSADAILRSDSLRVEGAAPVRSLTPLAWNGLVGEEVHPPPAINDRRLHATQRWQHANDTAGEYVLRLEVATRTGAHAVAEVPLMVGDTLTTCSVLMTGEPTCAVHGAAEKRSPLAAWGLVAALAFVLRRRR